MEGRRRTIHFGLAAVSATAVAGTAWALLVPDNGPDITSSRLQVQSETLLHTACSPARLSVAGGRQGENMGSAGEVVLTNGSPTSCALAPPSAVTLLDASGHVLPTFQLAPLQPVTPVLLSPGSSAYLNLYWANWCGAPPGPLQVSLAFADGTARGAYSGPPGYDFVPECISKRDRSTIQVDGWSSQSP